MYDLDWKLSADKELYKEKVKHDLTVLKVKLREVKNILEEITPSKECV